MGTTFLLTVFAWIFFRAESISHALSYIRGIFSASLFTIPLFEGRRRALITVVLVIFFLCVEWLGRRDQFAIEKLLNTMPRFLRWFVYYGIIVLIWQFGIKEQTFIYFQF